MIRFSTIGGVRTVDREALMLRLINRVQDYAWGSAIAIPELLGEPPTGGPVAELWLGAHPAAPSCAVLAGGAYLFQRLGVLVTWW